MDKNETLSIKIPNKEKCPCFKCKYNGGNPAGCSCMKFQLKPSAILYDNAKCPKFVEEDIDDEEDED